MLIWPPSSARSNSRGVGESVKTLWYDSYCVLNCIADACMDSNDNRCSIACCSARASAAMLSRRAASDLPLVENTGIDNPATNP